MLESDFKKWFTDTLEEEYDGCYIEKNSTDFIQGVPDLTWYWGIHWAKFEMKRSLNARREPNQPYYVDMFNRMSFARFVCPENVEEVLYDLQQTFKPRRDARLSQCQQLSLGKLRRRKARSSLS